MIMVDYREILRLQIRPFPGAFTLVKMGEEPKTPLYSVWYTG